MTFYDIDSNRQLTLDQIHQEFSRLIFVLKGVEREVQTKEKLSQMLTVEGISSDDVVVVRRKEKQNKNNKIDNKELINLLKKEHVFTQQQLEMYQKEPNFLFEKQMFRFKYGLFDGAEQMPQQREHELVSSILQGSDSWKESTLQQMQTLTKQYIKILKVNFQKENN